MSISQVSGSPSSEALGLLNLQGATKHARLKPAAATAQATPATPTTSTSSTASLDSTFLGLLTDELQNQDPTAPMDSTQMVGQMISLNQLDQLISINSAVGGSASTITSGAKKAQATSEAASRATAQPSSAATVAAKAALLNSLIPGGENGATNPLATGTLPNTTFLGSAAQPLDLSNFKLKSGVR